MLTQELLDIIEDGATLVRQGQFTLAVEKAQEKLKKFQLPDPRYYIAQVMQALLASGATSIEIKADESRVDILFDGPGYEEHELANLADAVFESGKNRKVDHMREMALGLLSLQGLRPKDISLFSNGYRWNKQSGPPSVTKSKSESSHRMLIVHTKNNTEEARILREVCQSCQADIVVNGAALCSRDRQRSTSCPWPNTGFQGSGFQGAFGIAYDNNIDASFLVLTRYGVVFSRRREARIQPSLVVEMEHEGLRKNASQSDVVEDEHYAQMLAELQRVQLEFAIQLSKQRVPNYQAEQVFLYWRQVVAQNVSPVMLEIAPEDLPPLERQLLEAPILACPGSRRCSIREVWLAYRTGGVVYYLEARGARLPEEFPPGAALLLPDGSAYQLRPLIPNLKPARGHYTPEPHPMPAVLARKQVNQDLTLILPDRPPDGQLLLYFEGEASVLQPTPLQFALQSSRMVRAQSPEGLQQTLQRFVEPLYAELVEGLEHPGPNSPPRPAALKAVLHYLDWKYGDCALALSMPAWARRGLFTTQQGAPVSLDDMRAWLEAYPAVVGTYGRSLGPEDHALLLTPAVLKLLQQLLGQEKVVLAQLADPQIQARGQQMGLSKASTLGVKVQEVVDEDEELAAIRREIEQASQSGLQVAVEEQPLDEARVLEQLGIKATTPVDPLINVQPTGLPRFANECLKATKSVGSRWLMRFHLESLEGQLLVHDGVLPKPLLPGKLLVQVGDADPVAMPTGSLGVCGWLALPADWQPQDPDGVVAIRPDSEPWEPGNSWADPEVKLDLPHPRIAGDYLWSIRRLFKLGAQHYAKNPNNPGLRSMWHKRLCQFLSFDEDWALSSPDSWFLKVPLFRRLDARMVDLLWLRQNPSLSWAPMGPGHSLKPEEVLVVTPPFQLTDLQRWIGRSLSAAPLIADEKPEEQLLAELKQCLVRICQQADCPLEPGWLEGLQFGPPTRWIGGPRKYFIEHKDANSTTLLNPADRLFLRLFRQTDRWSERVPVLSSAIYTAINRALDEVDDHHELDYLRTMLSQL